MKLLEAINLSLYQSFSYPYPSKMDEVAVGNVDVPFSRVTEPIDLEAFGGMRDAPCVQYLDYEVRKNRVCALDIGSPSDTHALVRWELSAGLHGDLAVDVSGVRKVLVDDAWASKLVARRSILAVMDPGQKIVALRTGTLVKNKKLTLCYNGEILTIKGELGDGTSEQQSALPQSIQISLARSNKILYRGCGYPLSLRVLRRNVRGLVSSLPDDAVVLLRNISSPTVTLTLYEELRSRCSKIYTSGLQHPTLVFDKNASR